MQAFQGTGKIGGCDTGIGGYDQIGKGDLPRKAESIIKTVEQMVNPKQRRILDKLLGNCINGKRFS